MKAKLIRAFYSDVVGPKYVHEVTSDDETNFYMRGEYKARLFTSKTDMDFVMFYLKEYDWKPEAVEPNNESKD